MIRLRQVQTVVALALAGSSAPVHAMPGGTAGFCAELERTIAAVVLGETATLERNSARPPGFGFRYGCSVQGSGWFCHQSLAPPTLSLSGLAEDVSHCRPALVRAGSSTPDHTLFEGAGVRILIMESGAPRAHVGRIITFSIEPRRTGQTQAKRSEQR